jgi:tetratricopeptide (TPR) repeat protein
MLPADGSLADHIQPALRDAGLTEEHDRCFEAAWRHLEAVIRRFPDGDNTRNTAAWLAARGNRRLDEAARHLERALAAKPNQAAYLDTMAELWFARGDRGRAVEWSRRAVAAEPEDAVLRRQLERFRTARFPRG